MGLPNAHRLLWLLNVQLGSALYCVFVFAFSGLFPPFSGALRASLLQQAWGSYSGLGGLLLFHVVLQAQARPGLSCIRTCCPPLSLIHHLLQSHRRPHQHNTTPDRVCNQTISGNSTPDISQNNCPGHTRTKINKCARPAPQTAPRAREPGSSGRQAPEAPDLASTGLCRRKDYWIMARCSAKVKPSSRLLIRWRR